MSCKLLLLFTGLLVVVTGCNSRKVEHSVPSLVRTLKEDKDPNMRYFAAESLGQFGAEATSAVPDLIAALKDENAMVRMGVAYALGEIGSSDAVPALQEASKDGEKQVRDAAVHALKQIQQKKPKKK
ncbi:MAG: HEAT repeat domain-containing protein [Planctomycetia bacterium]|nr:HEAT repeat domain-containing protein [Planctomycetia bacterium]